MNATIKSAAASVTKVVNQFNLWRDQVTQTCIDALLAGKQPDLKPYKTFPWNDQDDDRNEKSFSLSSTKKQFNYLTRDPRSIPELETCLLKAEKRFKWLNDCEGMVEWMEAKYNGSLKAAVDTEVLKSQNVLASKILAYKKYVANRGQDATVIKALKADIESAKAETVINVDRVREKFLADPNNAEFLSKIDGIRKTMAEVGDRTKAIESLKDAVKHYKVLIARRRLAGMLKPIVEEREDLLATRAADEAAAAEEAKAIIASIIPASILQAPRKAKVVVKTPAKSRGEITTSLDNLNVALVHKQVAAVAAKMVKKADALTLSGLDAETFEEMAYNAEMAGEEEMLCSPEAKALILVRKVGNARRFFVKQAA